MGQTHYAIIIDAGSSGSRVYVYKWAKVDKQIRNVLALDDASREGKDILGHNCNLFNIGDAGHDTGCWMKEPMANIPAADGGATATAACVKHHLKPLLDFAVEKIAAYANPGWQERTTLFVGATGGMRSCEAGRKARIEEEIRKFIQEYTGNSNFGAWHYATIPGAAEGYFGWVAANYSNPEYFGDPNHPNPGIFDGTKGYLEMGGQSMQVAFPTTSHVLDNRSHSRRVTIGGTHYNVYAREWKNHGVNAIWKEHMTCVYGDGHDRANANLNNSPNMDDCLPVGAKVPNYSHGNETGNFFACIRECFKYIGCARDECEKLESVANTCVTTGKRGCLICRLPKHVQQVVHGPGITGWVGGSNFFHGALGVFNDNDRNNVINDANGYQPVRLLLGAARLHGGIEVPTWVQRTTRNDAGGVPVAGAQRHLYEKTANFLWRAVFLAVYTTVILHKGFGIQIPRTQENPAGLIDEVIAALTVDPLISRINGKNPGQRQEAIDRVLATFPENLPGTLANRLTDAVAAPEADVRAAVLNDVRTAVKPVLEIFLGALATNSGKPYAIMNKPWALGAAVIIASQDDVTVEFDPYASLKDLVA